MARARRIHVVHGEPQARALAEQALSAAGYEVLLHDSGPALELALCVDRPDAVVLDLALPGGGRELLARLERGGRVRHVAVVLLDRPFDTTALLRAVAGAIGRGRYAA